MNVELKARELHDLIDRYWDLAYIEGKEGRSGDTEDGKAQQLRLKIDMAINAIARALEQPAKQPLERCPECYRPKAHDANDCAAGCCAKWYAVRDGEASAECEKLAAFWKQPEGREAVAFNYAMVHRFAIENRFDYNALAKLVRDSVYTTPPAKVPEGYVLVPVEPTDEMIEAAWDSDAADYVGEHKRIHSLSLAWKAMLTAAQQQEKK